MIQRLAWDSEFFGYEVGKVSLDKFQDLNQWTKELKKFQLVYIYSSERIINHWPQNVLHVGTIIKFKKRNDQGMEAVPLPFYSFDQADGIFELSNLDSSEFGILERKNQLYNSLTRLALKSGEFSRFKIDRRLIASEFKKLYTAWIQNAIAGRERIFVYIKDKIIRGFITFFSDQGKGKIGLMAVEELFRRNDIGSQLLQAAMIAAQLEGLEMLEVETQKANLPAMAMYQKSGFQLFEEKEVYHWWKMP